MKTADVLAAIEALDNAGAALRNGEPNIGRQMNLGKACYVASIRMRIELEKEHPEVKIETEAA